MDSKEKLTGNFKTKAQITERPGEPIFQEGRMTIGHAVYDRNSHKDSMAYTMRA